MKVYQAYKTDMYEQVDNTEVLGICSTVEKAREFIRKAMDRDCKLIIEEVIVDEYDSGAKLEVYTLENGLEWKSENSDANYGDMKMLLLTNTYYEVQSLPVLASDIERAIELYHRWCDDNNEEPEIEYMSASEFVSLDDAVIGHVLYHAELYKEVSLQEFFLALAEA